MKEGWEYKKLGEICSSIEDGDWIESKDQSPNGIRLIQTGNIGNGSYKDKKDNAKYISEETFKRLHCTEIFEGDILVSRLPDPVGRACTLPDLGCRCITAVDCSILKIKKDLVCNAWITYFMQSQAYFTIINSQCTGSTRLRITRKKLAEILIPVPPLSEQQSIVDYLDSAFAKIDAMKANAEKALNEAKTLFQASLKEKLEPKEGWKEKTMGDLCSIDSKLVDPTRPEHQNLIHVGGANISSYSGALIDLKNANEEKITSGKFMFDKSVVLYNKIRPYLVKVAKPNFSGLCSADMYPLTPNTLISRDYLYYILISKEFTDYAIKGSARAGMPKVNRDCLFAYKCCIPTYNEQLQIATYLDSIKSKVEQLQENFDKISQECDALKQAILKQVFE